MERVRDHPNPVESARFSRPALAIALLAFMAQAQPGSAATCPELREVDEIEAMMHALSESSPPSDLLRLGLLMSKTSVAVSRSSMPPELKRHVRRYLDLRQAALDRHGALRLQSIGEFVRSEAGRASYARAALVLKGDECSQNQEQSGARAPGRIDQVKSSIIGGSARDLAMKALLAAATIVLLAGGIAAWIRHETVKQRRAKRYICNFRAELRTEAERFFVAVVDISEVGAKLTAPAALRPHTAAWILLGGAWRKAAIVWNNSTYLGIEFKSPIAHSEVLALAQARRHSEKSAARQGADVPTGAATSLYAPAPGPGSVTPGAP